MDSKISSTERVKQVDKQKIITICFIISMILLIVSSITTVTILKIKKDNYVKELIKKY